MSCWSTSIPSMLRVQNRVAIDRVRLPSLQPMSMHLLLTNQRFSNTCSPEQLSQAGMRTSPFAAYHQSLDFGGLHPQCLQMLHAGGNRDRGKGPWMLLAKGLNRAEDALLWILLWIFARV